jgi:hypothetical protein
MQGSLAYATPDVWCQGRDADGLASTRTTKPEDLARLDACFISQLVGFTGRSVFAQSVVNR